MEQISIKEALISSIRQLNSIPIPAGLIEQIGIPVCAVIGQLTEIMKAINEKEGEKDGVGD